MKKIVTLLLAAILALGCTACGSRALTELTKYYGRQMSG